MCMEHELCTYLLSEQSEAVHWPCFMDLCLHMQWAIKTTFCHRNGLSCASSTVHALVQGFMHKDASNALVFWHDSDPLNPSLILKVGKVVKQ